MNEIILGDAIEEMNKMEEKSIDLILTDPPYNYLSDNTKGGGFMTDYNKKHLDKVKQSMTMFFNPTEFLNEAKRVMKKMNLYVFTNKNLLREYISFALDNKYSWDILLWLKPNPTPMNNYKYLLDKEYIVFMREANATFNSKLGYENYFTYFLHPIGRKGKVTKHATEKPIQFAEKVIQISSNPGNIVLDPYVGSGTFCVAAKKLGRKYIGIDNIESCVNITKERLSGWYHQSCNNNSIWAQPLEFYEKKK